MFNNRFSKLKKNTLNCSICQFPWLKYSHFGQYQATDTISLNAELGRDTEHVWVCSKYSTESKLTYQMYPLCVYLEGKQVSHNQHTQNWTNNLSLPHGQPCPCPGFPIWVYGITMQLILCVKSLLHFSSFSLPYPGHHQGLSILSSKYYIYLLLLRLCFHW